MITSATANVGLCKIIGTDQHGLPTEDIFRAPRLHPVQIFPFEMVAGPGEGFGMMVGLRDEAVDGGLEIDNASEDTALQSLLGKFGEEPLDGVEPRARGRREVDGEARVSDERNQKEREALAALVRARLRAVPEALRRRGLKLLLSQVP